MGRMAALQVVGACQIDKRGEIEAEGGFKEALQPHPEAWTAAAELCCVELKRKGWSEAGNHRT